MANKISTLKGYAKWAKVFEPDTKFDADGVYSVKLVLSQEEAAQLDESLGAIAQERFNEEVKRSPKLKNSLSIQMPIDSEFDMDGNETGNKEVKFKLKAKVRTREGSTYDQKPVVVDAKRNPMSGDSLIGNGSLVKVAYETIPYFVAATKVVGVTLRLKGLQVLELNEYANKGAGMFDDEDGYVEEARVAAERDPFAEDETEGAAAGDF